MVGRTLALLYGAVAYLVFLFTLVYMIGFVGHLVVGKSLASGPAGPFNVAVVVNVLLLAVFGAQHSLMARPGFKAWWTRFVPPAAERSTYVLLASVLLLLLFWAWQPMPNVLWSVEGPVWRGAIWALFGLGWALVLLSSFLINHFDLFGLRQVVLHWRGQPYTPVKFKLTWFYRHVRHPLMLGFLIAFWAVPTVTEGHLLFALGMTAYIFVGIRYEERDLARHFGQTYQDYRAQAGMVLPRLRKPSRQSRLKGRKG